MGSSEWLLCGCHFLTCMLLNISQTDVTIGESQFRFTYLPTADSIKSVASEFCINNQEALGIAPLTDETLGSCHNPIATHLRDVAVQHARDTTPLAVSMFLTLYTMYIHH